MELYKQLVAELKSELHSLELLYREREQLESERDALAEHRQEIADGLYEHLGNSEEIAAFAKTLESKDKEIRVLDVTLGALTTHLHSQEEAFHQKVPQACHTFTRLFNAFRHAVRQQSRQQISDLIYEAHRISHQQQIDELTEVSIRLLEATEIQVPAGGNWLLIRPLAPEDREQTMQFTVQTCRALTDAADELLHDLDKLSDVDIPEFLLGELPVTQAEPLPTVPDFREAWQSVAEREFVLTLCREAGKDLNNLSDHEKLVLQNSLENFRSQIQYKSQMGYTSWDGTQS
jgi:hypothetical protein